MEKRSETLWESWSRREKIVGYVLIVAAFLALALLSFALAPRQASGLSRCRDILLSQNRYSCLYHLAASTENSSVCGYISAPSSDQCYANVASITMNATTCSRISAASGRYLCVEGIANATDSYSECASLGGYQESSCMEAIALKLDSAQGCSHIPNATESLACSSAINLADAANFKNADYCGNVPETSNQSLVYHIVSLSAQVRSRNASQSFGLSSVSPAQYIESSGGIYSARDLCYVASVASSGNTSSCGSVVNVTLQDICVSYGYKQSAANQTSAVSINKTVLRSLCSQYKGSELQSCYTLADITEAVSSRNASVCTTINGTVLQYQCYSSLAKAYNDTAYCGYIPNSTYNQVCIEDIYYNAT